MAKCTKPFCDNHTSDVWCGLHTELDKAEKERDALREELERVKFELSETLDENETLNEALKIPEHHVANLSAKMASKAMAELERVKGELLQYTKDGQRLSQLLEEEGRELERVKGEKEGLELVISDAVRLLANAGAPWVAQNRLEEALAALRREGGE